MKRVPLVLAILLVISLAACGSPEMPTTSPTTVPTTFPTTKPTTEPTTMPTTAPTTEPVRTNEPRQEGQRLTAEELDLYGRVFSVQGDRYARHPVNYYNQALCFSFSDPSTIQLNSLFIAGFGTTWMEPLTDEEYEYINNNIGDLNYIGEIDRLPREQVEDILLYYFGLRFDDMNEDSVRGFYYYEDTDCYYFDPPGGLSHGNVVFYDGYYDEETRTVWLYYKNRIYEKEYCVVLQSKITVKQYGYYILSNLPVQE